MFTVEARRDRGQATVEFVALVGLAAAIMGVLMASNVPETVGTEFKTAVCRILERDDCAGAAPVAGSPPPGDRPAAGPRFAQGPPPPQFPDPRDLPDDTLEFNHEGLIEAEQYGSGYRVHIQGETTELLTGIVYDLCSRLADGDDDERREETGRCILAVIRNLNIDIPLPVGSGVVEDRLSDQLEHLTKDKRADDIMDAIEDVQSGEADCLTVSRTWGWGGQTNWSTGDFGGDHCERGSDPLGGRDIGDTDELLDAIDDVDDLDQVLNDPEAFVDEEIERRAREDYGIEDLDALPEDLQEIVERERQEALDAIGNVTRGIGGHVDLSEFLEDLEDALD